MSFNLLEKNALTRQTRFGWCRHTKNNKLHVGDCFSFLGFNIQLYISVTKLCFFLIIWRVHQISDLVAQW